MTDTPHVLIEQHGAILSIQLNRPQKKNALSPDMYNTITDALNQADADDSIHVVFLTGSGDSFCAGNDLKTFLENPTSDAATRFIKTITKAETPIVAAVNGLAVGVGVTMLLHCDFAYSVPNAIYNFAFVDLGLVPEAASSYLLPQLVGQRKAAELMMLGEKFDAHTAQEIGLVNTIIDGEDLHEKVWQIAERLAAKSPEALRLTKHLLKRGNAATIAETIDYELNIFGQRLASDEVRGIMQAFMSR